ncbi:MAG: discoidin domain-containing protein, partial [Bryobacterales bacterium]|nr:discoidin domain-containing protein [Bryobacterales bacterium]
IRVYQIHDVPTNLWIVNEVRVYLGSLEIERSNAWRLRSRFAPWLLPAAFDNSPSTSWSPWEGARSDQFLEVDFGATVRLDRIDIQTCRDSDFADYRVEAVDAAGGWQPVETTTARREMEADNTARESAMALHRMGFRYIVATRDHFSFPMLVRTKAAMGLEIAGQSETGAVFRIIPP